MVRVGRNSSESGTIVAHHDPTKMSSISYGKWTPRASCLYSRNLKVRASEAFDAQPVTHARMPLHVSGCPELVFEVLEETGL